MDKLVITHVDDLPEGVGLETRLHPKRRKYRPASQPPKSRSRNPQQPELAAPPSARYNEYGTAGPSSGNRPGPHRHLKDEPISKALFFGSDGDTDSDDNEDSPVSVLVPRTVTVLQETPVDEPPELMKSFHVLPNMCFLPAAPESPPPSHDSPSPPADIADTFEPRDLYNFNWQPFPSSMDPTLRREKFLSKNVGPTISSTDPYELFVSVWDQDIMQHIVDETNRYAQQRVTQMIENGTLMPWSRISRWKDTNIDEMFVYLALVIAMGTVQRTEIEDYWSKKSAVHETAGFRLYMSYNRYSLLSVCLHFRNNDEMFDAKLSYSEAKLFKISPIMKHLNHRFPSLYNLNQNLSIDESLLLWKGPLEINKLIPNKAAGVGIKSFEVCESQTGYLWRFEIHAQEKGAITQPGDILKTSTPAIVLRLVDGLENKGHTLWMDNYYNSPALARHLKSIGFDCAGTLRTNRLFVPQDLHELTTQTMRPGEFTGVTSGDVDVMVWRDASRVALISTYHGNGVVRDLESTKPIVVEDYNIAMGGVDKKDQMCAGFPVERKRGKVWYKKLFKRLLNVSILNTYIIHMQNSKRHKTRLLIHKDFRIKLVDTIMKKHGHINTTQKIASHSGLRKPAPTQNVVDITHRLSEFEARTGPRGEKPRRKCAVCKKRVTTFCVGCDKALCLPGDCFVIAHK